MLQCVFSFEILINCCLVSWSFSCLCRLNEIGDGRRCYGDVMERLIELHSSGTHTGQLVGAVALFGKMYNLKIYKKNPDFFSLAHSWKIFFSSVLKNHMRAKTVSRWRCFTALVPFNLTSRQFCLPLVAVKQHEKVKPPKYIKWTK